MIGLIILVITLMSAKNLPGVLEITLLHRLPLDPGARYAITALSQYTIAGIGIFSCLQHHRPAVFEHPVAGVRNGCRPRFWPARDRRQFH